MGTSSDKAVLVDFGGNIIATAVEPYPTFYPNPAWVEQNPEDYWHAVCKASSRIINENGINAEDVKGVVFSTQSQGIIPVDESGKVLYNNITWVDGRAEKQAQSIMKKLGGKKIFTLAAGTPIMGKDCIPKIVWLKEERPDLYRQTYRILDVNGYLKYKCTGKMVTELSGASSYGLDLKKKEWLGVMKLTGVDMEKLPPLVCSTDIVGGLLPEAAGGSGPPAVGLGRSGRFCVLLSIRGKPFRSSRDRSSWSSSPCVTTVSRRHESVRCRHPAGQSA